VQVTFELEYPWLPTYTFYAITSCLSIANTWSAYRTFHLKYNAHQSTYSALCWCNSPVRGTLCDLPVGLGLIITCNPLVLHCKHRERVNLTPTRRQSRVSHAQSHTVCNAININPVALESGHPKQKCRLTEHSYMESEHNNMILAYTQTAYDTSKIIGCSAASVCC